MLEGLKDLWFKELQPLPQSAEGTGIWPFTGNPRAWIDKSDPNYEPSIYADRPSIDVTGSGTIKSILKGKVKSIAPKIGDMIDLPGGKARFDGIWEAFGDHPEKYQYTYHEGPAKGDTFVSLSQDLADISKAGIKKLEMRGAKVPDSVDLKTFKKMTGISDDTAIKEIWEDFQAFSKDRDLPGEEMFEAWMSKHRAIQDMLKPMTSKFLKKKGLIKETSELDALVEEADDLLE